MGALSAADGSYFVPSMTAGDYVVSFQDEFSRYSAGYYSSSGFVLEEPDATHVTVGTTRVSGIDIVLPTGYSLSGAVRNADGTPIAGVEVSVCPKLAPSCTTYPSWTARDGTYTLPGIAPGTYTVTFSDPWQHQSPRTALPDLTIAGADVSWYDLSAPAGWITPGAAIDGVVRSVTGDPLVGVQVWVTGPDTTTNMVKTAADGSYLFGLAAGTYTLRFDEPIVAYHGIAGLVKTQADAAPIVLSGTHAVEVDGAISLPANGLWKLLPTHVGNTQVVAVYESTGSDLARYVATIPADSFTSDLLSAMGKTKTDILDITSARDHPEIGDVTVETISIDATKYGGASAEQIIGAYETAYRQWAPSHWSGCSTSRLTLAGKTVLASSCNGQAASLYVYAHGDTLFEISVKDQATAQAVVTSLP
jgi:hypothetical protein